MSQKKSYAERSVLAVELTLFFRCCILVALVEVGDTGGHGRRRVAEEAEESAAVGGVRPHERALLQAAGAVQRDGLLQVQRAFRLTSWCWVCEEGLTMSSNVKGTANGQARGQGRKRGDKYDCTILSRG